MNVIIGEFINQSAQTIYYILSAVYIALKIRKIRSKKKKEE